jgi:hypothetical protein
LCNRHSCLVFAQNTYFNKVLSLRPNSYAGAFSVIELESGYVINGSGYTTDINGWYGLIFFELDLYGNIVQHKEYSFPNHTTYQGLSSSFARVNDSLFVLGGSVSSHLTDTSKALFMMFDRNWDTLLTSRTTVYNRLKTIGHSIVPGHLENEYIMGGQATGIDGMVIALDKKGKEKWNKIYPTMSFTVCSITKLANKEYALGSSRLINGKYRAHVVRTDSIGNIINHFYLPGTYDDGTAKLATSYDNHLLVAYDSTLYANVAKNIVLKTDLNGNTIWRRSIGLSASYREIYKIIENNDSTITIGGTTFMGYEVSPLRPMHHPDFEGKIVSIDSGFLSKLSKDGDSLWVRGIYYCYNDTLFKTGEIGSIYYLLDFIPTKDGGYIGVGRAIPYNCGESDDQQMWVVKLNCMGFEAPPNAMSSVDTIVYLPQSKQYEVTFNNYTLYADEVIVDYGDGTTEQLTIKDPKNPLYNKKISHVYDTAGTYTIQLTAFACGDTSVWVETFVIDKYTSSVDDELFQKQRVKIYPNPTDNTLFIEGLRIDGINTINIKNTLGQVMLVTETASGQAAINVQQLPIGMYLVEIVSPSGSYTIEKIIVSY